MAKRFNNLDAALRYLRPVAQGDDGVVPDAPAGTPLRRYQEWKAGKININYTRETTSNPGRLNKISVKPFALAAASTAEYGTSISNRAASQYALFGLSNTELGIEDPDDDDVIAKGYRPAKAACRNITGSTASSKPSKLLGISYKSKESVGYSFPFGRTATNATYSEQKSAILASVVGASVTNAVKTVSFSPERF